MTTVDMINIVRALIVNRVEPTYKIPVGGKVTDFYQINYTSRHYADRPVFIARTIFYHSGTDTYEALTEAECEARRKALREERDNLFGKVTG